MKKNVIFFCILTSCFKKDIYYLKISHMYAISFDYIHPYSALSIPLTYLPPNFMFLKEKFIIYWPSGCSPYVRGHPLEHGKPASDNIPQEKWLSSPGSYKLATSVALRARPSPCWNFWLAWFWASNHSCHERMCAITMSSPGVRVPSMPSCPLGLTSFSPP